MGVMTLPTSGLTVASAVPVSNHNPIDSFGTMKSSRNNCFSASELAMVFSVTALPLLRKRNPCPPPL